MNKNKLYEDTFETVALGLNENTPEQEKFTTAETVIQALLVVTSMLKEEKECLKGVDLDSESMRQMAIKLGRDKNTIKKRLESARRKVEKSPLNGDEATCKQALRIACSMSDEKIKSIVGYVIDFESMRQIASELGRDNHTIKRRLESACDMLRESPLGASLRLEFDNMNKLSC